MEKKPMNFLEQVSYSFKHGKKKAQEESASHEKMEDPSGLEEIKRKRKKALAMMESSKPSGG